MARGLRNSRIWFEDRGFEDLARGFGSRIGIARGLDMVWSDLDQTIPPTRSPPRVECYNIPALPGIESRLISDTMGVSSVRYRRQPAPVQTESKTMTETTLMNTIAPVIPAVSDAIAAPVIPAAITVQNGPCDESYTIPNWRALTDDVKEYYIRYGFRESQTDSFAAIKRDQYPTGPVGDIACRDAKREAARARLADCLAGKVPGGKRTRDPVVTVAKAVETLAKMGFTPEMFAAAMAAKTASAAGLAAVAGALDVPAPASAPEAPASAPESPAPEAPAPEAPIVPPKVVQDVKARNESTRAARRANKR